jgi:hypothetical protein
LVPPATAAGRSASTAPTPVVPGVSLSGSGGASCSGGGTFYDGAGNVLDHATAPGGGGASPNHPVVVDPGGHFTYHGTSGTPITDHHWYVDFEGIQVRSGGSANTGHKTTTGGNETVTKYLPSHLVTGTYYVNGAISGTGGECSGATYVKLNGNPFATAGFALAVLLLVVALLLFIFGRPEVVEAAPGQGGTQP